MKIPISNILYGEKNNIFDANKISIETLNNLNFQKINKRKFPSIGLINKCLKLGPSVPTIVNASNEVLVDMFLKNKIGFLDIVRLVDKIFKDKDFKKYAKKKAKSVKDIKIVDNWARLKTINLCVR